MTTKPTEPDLVAEVEAFLNSSQHQLITYQTRQFMCRLIEEVKRLQTQLERDETCAVCSALLLADKSEPPHCIDCYVTDEVREQWEGNP